MNYRDMLLQDYFDEDYDVDDYMDEDYDEDYDVDDYMDEDYDEDYDVDDYMDEDYDEDYDDEYLNEGLVKDTIKYGPKKGWKKHKNRKARQEFVKNTGANIGKGVKGLTGANYKGGKRAAVIGANVGVGAGVGTAATSAISYAKFKKNAKKLYKDYMQSGGKLSYDEWYNKNSKKYVAGMISGAALGTAAGVGRGVMTKKFKEGYEMAEAIYEAAFEESLDSQYLNEGYLDEDLAYIEADDYATDVVASYCEALLLEEEKAKNDQKEKGKIRKKIGGAFSWVKQKGGAAGKKIGRQFAGTGYSGLNRAAVMGGTIGATAGAATTGAAAIELAALKKNGPNMYKKAVAKGETRSYDDWYAAKKKAIMIQGAVGLGTTALGAGTWATGKFVGKGAAQRRAAWKASSEQNKAKKAAKKAENAVKKESLAYLEGYTDYLIDADLV